MDVNAEFPVKLTAVRLEQLLNADIPMDSTLPGMVMDSSPDAIKAVSPMNLTLPGIVMDLRPDSRKADFPMDSNIE